MSQSIFTLIIFSLSKNEVDLYSMQSRDEDLIFLKDLDLRIF